MNKIEEVKQEVRHREWAEQVKECQGSGLPVKEWCKQNGVNVYTYYRRLRTLREEVLETKGTAAPQIVPISISNEISGTALIDQTPKSTPVPIADSKVIMRRDGIEIELPQDISEKTLLVLLRGLKEC